MRQRSLICASITIARNEGMIQRYKYRIYTILPVGGINLS